MKIGFALDDTLDKTDGVQQYLITLGAWLTKHGHEVHYLVANTKRTDIANIHSLGRVVNARFSGNNVRTPVFGNRQIIAQLIRELQLDILHVQTPYSPFLGERIIAATPMTTPVVGSFHILPINRWQKAFNTPLALIERSTLSRLQTVMAASPAAAEFAAKTYQLNTTIIPYPIDLARYRNKTQTYERRDEKLTVMFLGRLVARKGVIELIKAINSLDLETTNRIKLVIAGKGPLEKKARKLIKPSVVVEFPGFIPESEKPHFLSQADIAVFPATGGESFGIILIEAMAARAGVVLGGDNPGYSSVLSSLPESLFHPQDTKGFAKFLSNFIQNEDARTHLHQAQQTLVSDFDIESIGPKILKIYQTARRS